MTEAETNIHLAWCCAALAAVGLLCDFPLLSAGFLLFAGVALGRAHYIARHHRP